MSVSYRKKFGKQLAERDGLTCHYCGVRLLPIDTEAGWKHRELEHAFVDHIVARAQGGTDDLSNLVLCCMDCNCLKGHRIAYGDFREQQSQLRLQREASRLAR